MPFWIEPSPSSRAACRTCGHLIEHGAARIVIQDRNGYGSERLYHHLECAIANNPDVVLRALADVRPGATFDRADVEGRATAAVDHRGDAVRARVVEVAAAVAPGEAGPTDDALLDQLADDPDDRAALAVLADHLQQRGDPRGELIALQLAGDLSPRVLALQAELALPATATVGAATTTWGIGYFRSLSLGARSALAPIWSHPSLRLLRDLVLQFSDPLAPASIDYVIASVPRTLRHVSIGSPDPVDFPVRLAGALPRLEALTVWRQLDLQGLAHARLCQLVLHRDRDAAPFDAVVTQLDTAALPALDALSLRGPGDTRFDDLCDVLLRAGWLARLRTLRLHYGFLTAAGIATLAAGLRDRCLDVLDVSNTGIEAGDTDRLAPLCRELVLPDGMRRLGTATWIEHGQHPEWGRGRVVARRDGKLEIEFEHAGKKVFAATARVLVIKP